MAENSQWLDPAALNRLMHLTLLARSPMEGSVTGHHKSPHRGSSVEFAEYRNYVPGDDIRRLDWRVFARSDRFYMKEFEGPHGPNRAGGVVAILRGPHCLLCH